MKAIRTQVPDPAAALEYLRANMAFNGRAFSRALDQAHPTLTGEITALVYRTLDWSRFTNYEYGAYYSDGRTLMEDQSLAPFEWLDSPQGLLTNLICERMRAEEEAITICEHGLEGTADMLRLALNETRRFYTGADMLYYCLGSLTTYDQIRQMLREADWRTMVGAFAPSSHRAEIGLTVDEVACVAAAEAEIVFIPICDGEGYLVWEP